MPSFPVPGAVLDVSETGPQDAPVALVLHGVTASRAVDAASGFTWPDAIVNHRVIGYDARGHGRSTGRAQPEDYAWPALARDLLALADHYSPDRPVDAIGSSMGAATILHAALLAPERFGRLVLAIPPTAWSTRAEQQRNYERGADLVQRHGLERYAALTRVGSPPPAMGAQWPDPDVTEELLPAILRGAAASDLPEPYELASIRQPTLVLAWVEDPGHPLTTADQLTDLLPHAQLRIAQTPQDVAGWPSLAAAFLAS